MTDNPPDLTGLRTLSTITKTHVNWLWPNYLPQGKVAVLDGDPGVGKSLISCDLAARISTGTPMPNQSGGLTPPADVLFFAPEDDMADTVIPRLTAAGADRDRIHDYTTCGSGDNARLVTIPDDLDRIEHAITTHTVRLVVIDPVMAMLSPSVDTYKDHSLRRALTPLARIAAQHHCTVLMIRHLRKSDGPAIYRGGGSIGFAGLSRIVLCAARHPTIDGAGVLAVVKTNLGPKPASLEYRIGEHESKTATFSWEGTTELSADDILGPQPAERPRDHAKAFLLDELADGPKPAQQLIAEAELNDISQRTLQRAKAELDIGSILKNQEWLWGPGSET